MIETERLILDKAKYSDWREIYDSVWSRPSCAEYMFWNVTANEEEAQDRMRRTIAYQKDHYAYFIYEKAMRRPIGFYGYEVLSPELCRGLGLCIGPDYQRRGYGREAVRAIMEECRRIHGAKEYEYTAREENLPSRALALSLGFTLHRTEVRFCEKDNQNRTYLIFRRDLTRSFELS